MIKAPELERNTTSDRLLVLGEWFCAIHYLIRHVLELV
jgi:hypothetical protein